MMLILSCIAATFGVELPAVAYALGGAAIAGLLHAILTVMRGGR